MQRKSFGKMTCPIARSLAAGPAASERTRRRYAMVEQKRYPVLRSSRPCAADEKRHDDHKETTGGSFLHLCDAAPSTHSSVPVM